MVRLHSGLLTLKNIMQPVVSSFKNGERLTLKLECGHTMDAVNEAKEVPCFECAIEVNDVFNKTSKILLKLKGNNR